MKLPYSEGTVFLVPLRDSGYARGVVARSSRKGKILLGYFFAPCLQSTNLIEFDNLDPAKAVLCVRFGDLGLINGEWRILGNISNWNRTDWPMPKFIRRDPLGRKKPILVQYSDDSPDEIIKETYTTDSVEWGTDSLSGYGAVEIKLTKIINKK
jgi:Immunity protein 26